MDAERIRSLFSDWRLWLCLGRLLGLVTIIKSGYGGSIAWDAFTACALNFGLAHYFQRRRDR